LLNPPLFAPTPPPQALALLDSLAGGGDAFWERYSNAVLPQPLELTLPTCMPPELLPELQHAAIVAGAQAQQKRLAGLFPGLGAGMCQGGRTAPQAGCRFAACIALQAASLQACWLYSCPSLIVQSPAAPLRPSCRVQAGPAGCSGALGVCAAAPSSCGRTALPLCPSWMSPTMPTTPPATSGRAEGEGGVEWNGVGRLLCMLKASVHGGIGVGVCSSSCRYSQVAAVHVLNCASDR
jgi:hypothetical protein